MAFTIAFDVPETDGPGFPSRVYPASTATLTPSLQDASLFWTEEQAEAFLASDDVPFSLRPWGVVVEVDQP